MPPDLATGELGAHALKHQALVRRMLVDDDDAVGRLGNDVGLVQLAPRRTQRIGLDRLRRRLRDDGRCQRRLVGGSVSR